MTDEEKAVYEDGVRKGESRASWVFDGNTPTEAYAAFLKGWKDGDPIILDAYDPNFSIGEHAGESAKELGIEGFEDYFLDGFQEGYWDELQRVARIHTSNVT